MWRERPPPLLDLARGVLQPTAAPDPADSGFLENPETPRKTRASKPVDVTVTSAVKAVGFPLFLLMRLCLHRWTAQMRHGRCLPVKLNSVV